MPDKKMSRSEILDLEVQWKLYLERVGHSEEKMHPQQKAETKRAFFGACGQILILFRDVLGSEEDEDKAVLQMEDLFNQVEIFWRDEMEKQMKSKP